MKLNGEAAAVPIERPGAQRGGLALAGLAVLGLYSIVSQLVPLRRAVTVGSPLDAAIPFRPEWVWIYAGIYAIAAVPLFILRDPRVLRRTVQGLLASNLVANLVFLLFPTRIERPEALVHPAESFVQWGLGLTYYLDRPVSCLPSLHVANAFFVAALAASLDRRVGRVLVCLATLIAASTLLIKQHYVADVLLGAPLGIAAARWITIPPAGWPPRVVPTPRRSWWWIAAVHLAFVAVIVSLWALGWQYAWPRPAH